MEKKVGRGAKKPFYESTRTFSEIIAQRQYNKKKKVLGYINKIKQIPEFQGKDIITIDLRNYIVTYKDNPILNLK